MLDSKKQIDIIFIHPNSSQIIYQDLSKEYSAIEPPLWAGILAKHCLKQGFGVEIIDCEALQLEDSLTVTTIEYYNPKYVCFVVYGQQPSASTQNMEGAVRLSRLLRLQLPHIRIIFVGTHIAALQEEVMIKHPEIDFCCQNEGVYTISNLLKTNGKNNEYEKVPGLIYRYEGGYIVKSLPAKLVSQELMTIDLPGVAWDYIPINDYRTALWHSYTNYADRTHFASIYTSLGCPFNCNFCCINAPFGKHSYRTWPPEFIIQQLQILADKGIRNLKIADEMFVLNPNHFLEICDLIINKGLKFNIWCYARLDTIKEKYLEVMKKAGINWLGIGIESINDIKNKNVDIKKIIDLIHIYDINIAANYIFGLPEDNQQTMSQTLQLAFDLNTEMANFYCAMAYPGSDLYIQAKKNGWKLPETYSGYSQHSYDCQPLPSKYLKSEEILSFRDKAWQIYHSRDSYKALILNKFGNEALNRLNKSLEIKLKRKILND